MFSPDPIRLDLPPDGEALDAALAALPQSGAVFLLELEPGQRPYLGRCSQLRRRVNRMLRPTATPSRLLNLRGLARSLVYWQCGSSLEATFTLLEQARRHFPDTYGRMLRLRFPAFVRLLAGNRFPRLTVGNQPGDPAFAFGPFLYRTHAEEFASRSLDFFQIRRCDEELDPHPQHPGCVYGEMKLCLRPCQQPSVEVPYRDEARSLLQYLSTSGNSLREPWEAQREAASDALDFEAAARLHKRLGKLEECWRGLGDFVGLLKHFDGVAITRGQQPETVILWPVSAGRLHSPATLLLQGLSQHDIHQLLSPLLAEAPRPFVETEREHLAVLTKWKHSTWCDGEWVRIQDREKIPARRILNAAKRLFAPEGSGPAEGSPDREHSTASQPAVEAPQLPDHHR